ncbi:M48 family metallopeptidase [Desulfovibrio sp. OttesenSCG-928-C06]|nr:M48 family metallopeptidase [Desulfovibrio sp. OttesenSCG-928-C06]
MNKYTQAARLRPLLALLLCLLFIQSCASTPYTNRRQFIIMSSSQELQLGEQAADEVVKSEKIEKGTANAARVERIGKRIAAVADRPDFKWEFHTITKDELNAFCLPGGKVFVYTGMLKLVGNSDDELAAVIGHEVAHAIARHSAERASQSMAAQLGVTAISIGVAVKSDSAGAGAVAATAGTALAQLGVLLPYNRMQESESDHIGVILSAKAGYNPRAAINLWRKMGEASGGQNPPAMLSTHPLNEQRIRDLEKVMPEAMQYYQKK